MESPQVQEPAPELNPADLPDLPPELNSDVNPPFQIMDWQLLGEDEKIHIEGPPQDGHGVPIYEPPEADQPEPDQQPPPIIQCPICPETFVSEITFDDHYFLTHERNIFQFQPPEQKLEIKVKNLLSCKICEQTFRHRQQLEAHFEEAHNDYEQLMILDNYNGGGFPGFDILIQLNMIREGKKPETKCPICCEEYGNLIMPLQLECCKMQVCHHCLKRQIQTKNRVECMFCYKDYETLEEPLCFVEKTDDYDVSKWRDWWEKHVDIFF